MASQRWQSSQLDGVAQRAVWRCAPTWLTVKEICFPSLQFAQVYFSSQRLLARLSPPPFLSFQKQKAESQPGGFLGCHLQNWCGGSYLWKGYSNGAGLFQTLPFKIKIENNELLNSQHSHLDYSSLLSPSRLQCCARRKEHNYTNCRKKYIKLKYFPELI